MAETTPISWTDHTFSPWWGCQKISPACENCYAATLADRYRRKVWGPRADRLVVADSTWKNPLKWNRQAPARVFCGSMCDVFEDHPTCNATRSRLFELICNTPRLSWQLLTKRPENIATMLPADWGDGYPNVWLGASIENNDYLWRAGALAQIPARVRFISYEPALGPLDHLNLTGIHWLIYGGESGPGFRKDQEQWARDIHEHCRAHGVAFFYKQSAALRNGTILVSGPHVVQELPISKGEK